MIKTIPLILLPRFEFPRMKRQVSKKMRWVWKREHEISSYIHSIMSAPVIFGGHYQSKTKLLFNCLFLSVYLFVAIWRLSRLLFLSIIPPVYHDILATGFSPSFENKLSYSSLFHSFSVFVPYRY